ncbi:hypothetical protein L9F63_011239, partial [Diploptera punctata]
EVFYSELLFYYKLSKKYVILIVFFPPEFKYIGFLPSRKVSERQPFIISNTLIFSTFTKILLPTVLW